jgi:hypothetical protein
MNTIFDWCVDLLYRISHLTGFSYKEINVILFVIVHPIITLLFIWLFFRYYRLYRRAVGK